MFKIAVHSRSYEIEKLDYFRSFFSEIAKREVELLVSRDLATHLATHEVPLPPHIIFRKPADVAGVDFIFSLGGDGTLLETVTYIKGTDIPVMGINTGRLGFLSNTPSSQISEAIEAVFNGYYEIDKRTLIQLETDQDIFGGVNFGLNEFAITKRDTSSMIIVHTYIDGEYLNSYWADGLIVATPTGSTGYSLSVGGPVVIPHSSNFIISPVSPHNLNVRPLVVSDDCVISFEIEGRSKNFLVSLDSRSKVVDGNVQMAVRKCPKQINLVNLNGNNFLNTLRKKLNWGYDVRN
ncbi:MAG: NAD+ kinase [Flammeovirgaceae bacterium]|jgi:NAD+ kinase